MKNTKLVIKICYRLLLYGFALIGVVIIATALYLFFDKAGNCLDTGGVWDADNKRCRFDCDKWQKAKGCIVLNESDK